MDSTAATPLPETELDELIFTNQKLKAFLLLKQRDGLSLADALTVFTARYDKLRTTGPDRFVCDHDKYWEGFYS